MATDDCLKCGHFNGLGKRCKDQSTMRAVCLDGCSFFDNKETPIMNQCEIDGCKKMIDGRCTTNNYNPETWKLVGKGDKHTLCYAFTPKPKEPPMIKEKDCRRCEKYDEEGYCTHREGDKFHVHDPTKTCTPFTPLQGRDCRNCQGFNGQGEACGIRGKRANTITTGCNVFEPLQTSKPSPTVLTYGDEDEGAVDTITKGDKTLSLENVWASRPCGDEYREMLVVFTDKGFNPDTEIPFTQENLDLLSYTAFAWLLGNNFFLKAKEKEKPVYGVGQWFTHKSSPENLYLLCEGREPPSVLLMRVFGNQPSTQCSPGRWNTIEDADIGHTNWKELTPIDSPIKD